MLRTKLMDSKTVEVNDTLMIDFSLQISSQEDLETKLALLSSLGIGVDASVLLIHVDGTVNQPRVTNVECDVE